MSRSRASRAVSGRSGRARQALITQVTGRGYRNQDQRRAQLVDKQLVFAEAVQAVDDDALMMPSASRSFGSEISAIAAMPCARAVLRARCVHWPGLTSQPRRRTSSTTTAPKRSVKKPCAQVLGADGFARARHADQRHSSRFSSFSAIRYLASAFRLAAQDYTVRIQCANLVWIGGETC